MSALTHAYLTIYTSDAALEGCNDSNWFHNYYLIRAPWCGEVWPRCDTGANKRSSSRRRMTDVIKPAVAAGLYKAHRWDALQNKQFKHLCDVWTAGRSDSTRMSPTRLSLHGWRFERGSPVNLIICLTDHPTRWLIRGLWTCWFSSWLIRARTFTWPPLHPPPPSACMVML